MNDSTRGAASRTDERKRRRRRRWLFAPLLVATCFGVALAVAALLNVTSPSLGSNTVVTAACDSDGLTATLNYSYSSTIGGYVVDSVSLAGLANACRNNDYSVSLVDSGALLAASTLNDVPVASFGGTNNANTLSLSFTSASPRVSVEAVTSIHVAISN